MTTTTNLTALETQAREAQAALNEARERAEAERSQRAAERVDRKRAFEQAFLDDYDPRRLRAEVVRTFEAMVAAVRSGDLPAATVDHIGAILRETADAQRARDALGLDLAPRPEIVRKITGPRAAAYPGGVAIVGPEEWRDYRNQPITTVTGDAIREYVQRATASAIAEAAWRAEAERTDAIDQAREAAEQGEQ